MGNYKCAYCTSDNKFYDYHRMPSGGKQCECTKDWDQIEGYKMRKMRDRDARIWTGYTYGKHRNWNWGWNWASNAGKTEQFIMDLTYYRLGDHTMKAETSLKVHKPPMLSRMLSLRNSLSGQSKRSIHVKGQSRWTSWACKITLLNVKSI